MKGKPNSPSCVKATEKRFKCARTWEILLHWIYDSVTSGYFLKYTHTPSALKSAS